MVERDGSGPKVGNKSTNGLSSWNSKSIYGNNITVCTRKSSCTFLRVKQQQLQSNKQRCHNGQTYTEVFLIMIL